MYEARPVKMISPAPARILGVVGDATEQGARRLQPVDKKFRYEVEIPAKELGEAKTGDLVAVEVYATPRFGDHSKAACLKTMAR